MDAMNAPVVTSRSSGRGGSLPDNEYADFQLQRHLPGDARARSSFPAVQTCGDTQVAWIEIPAAGQDPETLEHPAPTVTVVAPSRASPAP